MRELGAELYDFLRDKRPDYGLICKVSRIYRDARRLFGRGPYKDHLWLSIRQPAEEWVDMPTFWFELAPEGWSYGMGYWVSKPVTMAKLRARIDRDPKPLEKLARRLNKHPDFALYGEEYKRPKGDPGALLSPWYNRRQIGVGADFNCEGVLFTPGLVEQVMASFEFLLPYYEYMMALTGDPDPTHD